MRAERTGACRQVAEPRPALAASRSPTEGAKARSRVRQEAGGDLGSSSPAPGPGSTGRCRSLRWPGVREQRPAGKEHGRGPHGCGLGWERTPDKAPGSCVLRPLPCTCWAHAAQLSRRPPRRHFQPSWPGPAPGAPHSDPHADHSTSASSGPPSLPPPPHPPRQRPTPPGRLDTPTSPAAPVVRRHPQPQPQPRRTQHQLPARPCPRPPGLCRAPQATHPDPHPALTLAPLRNRGSSQEGGSPAPKPPAPCSPAPAPPTQAPQTGLQLPARPPLPDTPTPSSSLLTAPTQGHQRSPRGVQQGVCAHTSPPRSSLPESRGLGLPVSRGVLTPPSAQGAQRPALSHSQAHPCPRGQEGAGSGTA